MRISQEIRDLRAIAENCMDLSCIAGMAQPYRAVVLLSAAKKLLDAITGGGAKKYTRTGYKSNR